MPRRTTLVQPTAFKVPVEGKALARAPPKHQQNYRKTVECDPAIDGTTGITFYIAAPTFPVCILFYVSVMSIFLSGALPPLAKSQTKKRRLEADLPPYSDEGKFAKFSETLFSVSPLKAFVDGPPRILDTGMLEALDWSKTIDLAFSVKHVLIDAIRAAGLESKFRLFIGVSPLSQDLQTITILNGDVLVATVMVVFPEDGTLDDPVLLNKMYERLLSLKIYHGIDKPFGIMTSYENWRVVWLPEDNAAAAEVTLPSFTLAKLQRVDLWDILHPCPRCMYLVGDSLPDPTIRAVGLENREISCTRVIKYNEPILPTILASAILKISKAVVDPREFDDILKRRFTMCMAPGKVSWECRQGDAVRFDLTPSDSHVKFYLLADLTGTGRIWLSCVEPGFGCVLKLFGGDDRGEAMAMKESRLWNKIWKMNTFVLKLGTRFACVLPYVGQCPESFRDKTQYCVRAAIKRMASRRFQHMDLTWSQVGLYQDIDGEMLAVFLDLASAKENVNSREAEAAMLEDLGLS